MNRHVFGPVPSRRLGISLGIDIIPFKTCTLDCVYCECGRTTVLTGTRSSFVNPDLILAEVRKNLADLEKIDYLTFSGSGEPTLHSELGAIIRGLKKEHHFPVAVLTNGTLLFKPEVRAQLKAADLILPSLDAASEEVFRAVNQPHHDITLADHLAGLRALRRDFPGQIWLEVFIVKDVNDHDQHIERLAEVIKSIAPDKVQLNALDRPPAVAGIEPPPMTTLESIRERWSTLPMEVEIIKRARYREDLPVYCINLENSLLNILRRRPLIMEDLIRMTSRPALEIRKYLDILENEGKIMPVISGNKIFFKAR